MRSASCTKSAKDAGTRKHREARQVNLLMSRPSMLPPKPGTIRPMQAQDLERLVTVAMPFGKYKGRLIADLPGHYLNWFAREGFPPGELGRLLALMHELDHNGLKRLLDPLRKRG